MARQRGLVHATGQPPSGQIYRYDAYGNAIGFNPSTAATSLLYSGEKTDLTGLQYLRARYYNPATGTFNRLDPFFGSFRDPLSLHKYIYCHGDGINFSDPSGRFETTIGMLSAITIGMTVASVAFPVIGAAYLSIRGDISPMRVIDHLTNPITWLSSAALVIGAGAVTSVAMQQVVMRFGKQFAARALPVVGLMFAAYGCYESLKMTYNMVTGKLPPTDAELYVALMLESTIIAVITAQKLSRMPGTGAGNDEAFWAASADDQATYLTGQGAVPKSVWDPLVSEGLVLQRLFSFSTAPMQFFTTSCFVTFLCDAISLRSPVAPRDDFVHVPLPQIE